MCVTLTRKQRIFYETIDKPLCENPTLEDTNLQLVNSQNFYQYKDTIEFKCRNGFGLSTKYNSSRCISEDKTDEKGTVVGVWEHPVPKCEVRGSSVSRKNKLYMLQAVLPGRAATVSKVLMNKTMLIIAAFEEIICDGTVMTSQWRQTN